MQVGIFGGGTLLNSTVDAFVAAVRTARDEGFPTFWLPQMTQIFGFDALTVAAIAGREVPGIELATAVVPVYPRHPVMLAGQAVTAQHCTDGSFTLGIGLSHRHVIEPMFGASYDRPARYMTEYLQILMPLVHGERVESTGELVSGAAAIDLGAIAPVPVLVAALGPRMLRVAGELADGTITWMTGLRSLESHVVPRLADAARAVARPAPRVAVGLPICVTDDRDGVVERATSSLAFYGTLPSYRAMLDREGVTHPVEIAIIGDERAVSAELGRLRDAGATDFVAWEIGTPEEQAATRRFLRSHVSV